LRSLQHYNDLAPVNDILVQKENHYHEFIYAKYFSVPHYRNVVEEACLNE